VAESFYKKLLSTNQLQFTAIRANHVRHLISVAISTDQDALLEKEIIADEIKDTLFNMKTNNALGPDGFPMEFFKSAWSVVGQDFIAAIKDFFVSSRGGQNPPDPTNPSRPAPSRPDPGGFYAFFRGFGLKITKPGRGGSGLGYNKISWSGTRPAPNIPADIP
jgi:hypothetical protein